MPVPYRKAPKSAAARCAAFVDVVWLKSPQTFYGALLLIDGRGQPLEFVYNSLVAPAGFLWPTDQVQSLGVASVCHSLFEACRRDPELLVCRQSLGTPEFCRREIDSAIPFAQVAHAPPGSPTAWAWLNDPPTVGMSAHSLAEELQRRGFALEPFDRIRDGLREVFPQAPWQEAPDDPDASAHH